MSIANVLLYAGVAVAGISLVSGIAVFTILWIIKIRINKKLDHEYGKKQG